MNEEKILEALAELTAAVQNGFADMTGRIESIESRLGRQKKKARKTIKRQQLQASEIAALKEIVYDLAKREPLHKIRGGGTAIQKEAAYRAFEKRGVDKQTALWALDEAGALRTDSSGKRTPVVHVNGKFLRALVVIEDKG